MNKSTIEFSGPKGRLLASQLQRAISACQCVLDKYPEQLDEDGISKDPYGYRNNLHIYIAEADRFLRFFKTAADTAATTIALTIDDAAQIQSLIDNGYILAYVERGLQRVSAREGGDQ